MNAEILCVGTELLMGQITNTNARYISEKLPETGTGVYYQSVVGDNRLRLKEVLKIALERSDLVIITGGLGPTRDDLTKETVAEILNRELIEDEETTNKIKSFFSKLNRPMTENNLKQAYFPRGSIIIRNKNGTAPGCIIESGKNILIMLPGPPKEMVPMFDETVIPFLLKKSKSRLYSKYIKIFGIGESSIEEKIIDLIDRQSNPTIAPYASEGEVTLRITAKCSDPEEGEKLISPVLQTISERLGSQIYSVNNESLEEVVDKMLIEKNISIALAESCTGGLLASKITQKPGISKVFPGGFITYSNEMKMHYLNVKKETLDVYGAVSRETATQMARGVREATGVDIGLSITGIAGPEGGTAEKPVGLVYIGLADTQGIICKEIRLWGDRNRIRNVTTLHALDMIRRQISKLS